jgi:hypothetical protein
MTSRMKFARFSALVVVSIPVLVAALYILGGDYSMVSQRWFVRTLGDVMDWRSRWIAGVDAVDCGAVNPGGNTTVSTDCALQAFSAHRPFSVRYGLKTVDIRMAAGLVGERSGRVYEMVFWGGGPGTDVFRQRVYLNQCPTPVSLRKTPKGRLTCFPLGPRTHEEWTSSWLSDAP